jgi:peptidoglycan hydrolase-like protein with peptidoglycan-binding domain
MRRALAIATTIAAVFTSAVFFTAGSASADPSADDWYQLRMCESTNRYSVDTGTGYYGAYQFDKSTWASVGGTGLPSDATPAEQDYRALILYRNRGWSPWVCATLIGLSEDSDARTKVAPPVGGNQSSGSGASEGAPAASTDGAPAWPGRQFAEGDSSEELKAWQKQMGTRGYDLVGTGYFGPKTKAAVLDLQAKAGLNVVGYIGPKTWAAAWSNGGQAAAPAAAAPAATYVPATNESCGVGQATAPAWPGKQFVQGDTDRDLQCFQRQLGSRGYGLTGTGYYGPATKTAVVALQQRNGINPSGILGPLTWAAAWQGS